MRDAKSTPFLWLESSTTNLKTCDDNNATPPRLKQPNKYTYFVWSIDGEREEEREEEEMFRSASLGALQSSLWNI